MSQNPESVPTAAQVGAVPPPPPPPPPAPVTPAPEPPAAAVTPVSEPPATPVTPVPEPPAAPITPVPEPPAAPVAAAPDVPVTPVPESPAPAPVPTAFQPQAAAPAQMPVTPVAEPPAAALAAGYAPATTPATVTGQMPVATYGTYPAAQAGPAATAQPMAQPTSTAGATAAGNALASLKILTIIASLVLHGHLNEAFDLATSSKTARWTSLIALPVLSALLLVVVVWAFFRGTESLLINAVGLPVAAGLDISIFRLHGLEFGEVLTVFVAGLVAVTLTMVTAVAVMRLCFTVRHTPVDLHRLTAAYAVSVTPLVLALPVFIILIMLPISALQTLAGLLFLVAWYATSLLRVLACYIATARIGRFTPPVAVLYVALTTAFMVLYSLLAYLLAR